MNSFKHSLTYGLGAVMIAIVLSMIIHLLGMYDSLLNYLSYVGFIVMVVFGLKAWRDKENGGTLSYGKAYGYSSWIALIFSIIMAIWAFVFFMYIAHDEMLTMQAEKMAQAAEDMRTKYHMSESAIESQMEMSKKFMGPGVLVIGALVGNMFMLSIVNLIIAAIMKKEALPNSDNQINTPAA